MEKLIINARTRTVSGKKAVKKLRTEGLLPAVMYNSKGEAVMLDVNYADFSKVRKVTTPTTLISLSVDGKKGLPAFIKDTHYNILTNDDIHADFHVIEESVTLKAKMKVQVSGTPIGVREGGFLEKGIGKVVIQCLPKDLPQRIVADVSNLAIGMQIKVKDLPFEQSVKVLTDSEAIVAQVRGLKA